MHQIYDCDPASPANQPGLYIDVGGVYALGYKLDSDVFERAARAALQEAEDEGEPLTLFPGKDQAIEEMGGSREYRSWLRSLSLETLAGELVADRLMSTAAVFDAVDEECGIDSDDCDLSFAIRCKLRLNQR